MAIEIRELSTKKDYKDFVNLPFEIYKDNAFWVPPLKNDELKSLQAKTNPAFEFCDVKFWIALKDGKCCGRIGAIINEKHIEKTGEKIGRFSRTEFFDDYEISSKLFETAENWIREKGMVGIHGPLGFSNLDTQGMLVEGFDHLPSIASVYHMPYYQKHLEKLGYVKETDWVEFRLKLADEIPAKAIKLSKIIKKRYNLSVVGFTSNDELRPYGHRIFSLLNEAFKDLFSVVPLNEKMIDYYIDRYFNLLNPKFIKVIEDADKNIIGFIVGLPSLSKAMQKAKGKLFPLGFTHIKKALKDPEEVDLMLTGIDPKKQGMGVSALLIHELQQVMIDHKVKFVETTGIFETNHKAIQHWKNYDNIQHKRKRCYKKTL